MGAFVTVLFHVHYLYVCNVYSRWRLSVTVGSYTR